MYVAFRCIAGKIVVVSVFYASRSSLYCGLHTRFACVSVIRKLADQEEHKLPRWICRRHFISLGTIWIIGWFFICLVGHMKIGTFNWINQLASLGCSYNPSRLFCIAILRLILVYANEHFFNRLFMLFFTFKIITNVAATRGVSTSIYKVHPH
jgi:hypothetical protein